MKKKVLSLLLASAMIASMAACGNDSNTPASSDVSASGSTSTEESSSETEQVVDDNATYTYNLGISEFPTNWNPHQYQTNTDNEYMMQYLSSQFYDFDFNDTMDGYELVPRMATGDPVDITADYVGKYGVEEGDTAKVWKIPLRDDLKWEDGTPITAYDFVTSAKLVLNPVAHNYRADSQYSGNKSVYNAKAYAYQGQTVYVTPMVDMDAGTYVDMADLVTNDDGVYTVNGGEVVFNLNDGCNWSSNSLTDYHDAGYFTNAGWDEVIVPAADEDGFVKVTEDVWTALTDIIATLQGKDSFDAYAADAGDYAYQEWEEFCYVGETYGEMDFSEVGFFALSDTELCLALEKPLSGFMLLYSLTDSWLVNEKLYTECESVTDGVYNNTYGTSVETTISYGPYKLTAFQADKQYTLEKNTNYFEGNGDGLYQTTAIVFNSVGEAATRLEMFLSGQLDSYGLTKEDMEAYSTSDYTYYTDGDSTFFIALNPDFDALKSAQEALGANYNKTILTIKEFRQALAYAVDRSAFALAASPLNGPAFGVFSSTIISQPEIGETYRSTEQAKWVLANFWGLADDIGDGKMYATVDDAVESITGYNLAMAKEYFDKAYDMAIEQGIMKEGDTVAIMIGTPNSTSSFYNGGYDYLVNCYTDAVKGTKLEGKLEFSRDDTLGNGFSDALKSNKVDMLFGVGWTGSALDPYGLMEAYTSSNYQYDPSWDTTTDMLTITLDGKDYTASVWDWTQAIGGTVVTIKDADGNQSEFSAGTSDGIDEERFEILCALENAVLSTYDMIPLVGDASANLKGMQIQYYSEDYVFGPGRGGVRRMTYNYTDAEWDEYVASQGGTLNYN